MNPTMERFLEECRAQPFFIETPGAIEKIETCMRVIYENIDERPAVQAVEERICAVIGDTKRPFSERLWVFQEIRLELDRALNS
jgi:hypothetical protein